MKQDRLVRLEGTVNFRDIGGYRNQAGQLVGWHKLYRSDSLSRLSRSDLDQLVKRRITVNCDLRSTSEQRSYPDTTWPGVKRLDCHLYPETERDYQNEMGQFKRFVHRIRSQDSYLGDIYQRVLLNRFSQAAFAQVFDAILKLPEEEALVYHCSAGKDRTGMVTALLLMALGVSDETIARDYLLTNQLYDFAWQKQRPNEDDLTKLVAQMNVTQGDGTAILGITQTIREGWGDFDGFFTKALGFKNHDLMTLRHLYLS